MLILGMVGSHCITYVSVMYDYPRTIISRASTIGLLEQSIVPRFFSNEISPQLVTLYASSRALDPGSSLEESTVAIHPRW